MFVGVWTRIKMLPVSSSIGRSTLFTESGMISGLWSLPTLNRELHRKLGGPDHFGRSSLLIVCTCLDGAIWL